MRKAIFLAPFILASCATVPAETQTVNAEPVTFVFPKDSCNAYQINTDDDLKVYPTFQEKESVLIDIIAHKKMSISINRGSYQANNMTFSSSTYNINVKQSNGDDYCKITTISPYTLVKTHSNSTDKVLAPAAEFTPQQITKFLKDSAGALIRFDIESPYSSKAVFANSGATIEPMLSNKDLNKFTGHSAVMYDGKWREYGITVLPYKNGSKASISFNAIPNIKGNTVDFSKSANDISALIKKKLEQ